MLTKKILDTLADVRDPHCTLILRGVSLHKRAGEARGARAAMLESMSKAYLARGLAVSHRIHKSFQTAVALEEDSLKHLADAQAAAVGAI